MTSISATSGYSTYTNYNYSNSSSASAASKSASKSTGSTYSSSATNVTLSASAQAAMASKTFEEVIAEAREKMTAILADADTDSPYKDGKLVVDLTGLDRRELYAILSGADDSTFTANEVKAAENELQARFDRAMAGPMAVYEVTGKVDKLYEAALAFLEDASPEEKATSDWIASHDAVKEAMAQLATNPGVWPDVENDPVADFIRRSETGDTAEEPDFSTVADNARRALDQQIADAKAAGKDLVYSSHRKTGIKADFSDFSSRALSAISLNEGDQFSAEEIRAAKGELDSRARQVLLSCLNTSGSSSDPTALSLNLISAYNSLSPEELQAVGWSESFYETAVANYQTASMLTNMLNSTSSGLFGSSSGGSSGWPF